MLCVLLLVSSVDARLAELRNRHHSSTTDTALVPQNLQYTTCVLPPAINASQQETQLVAGAFPNVQNPTFHGASTSSYNCIAWTVGITNQWINPPANGANGFDNFYVTQHGLVQSVARAVVDAWAHNGENTHGSVKCGQTWTSKLGKGPLITHARNALAGNIYGAVIRNYKEAGGDLRRRLLSDKKETEVTMMRSQLDPWANTFSRAQKDEIKSLTGVSVEKKTLFEGHWAAWERNIESNEKLYVSDNTKDYASAEGFEDLTKFGEEGLPLLINMMFTHRAFWALIPYDAIAVEINPKLVIPHNGQSEQERVIQTVKAFLAHKAKPQNEVASGPG